MKAPSRSVTRNWLTQMATVVRAATANAALNDLDKVGVALEALNRVADRLDEAATGDVKLQLISLLGDRVRAQYATYNARQRERMIEWMVGSVSYDLVELAPPKLVSTAIENWRRYAGSDPRGAWEYMSEQELPPPDTEPIKHSPVECGPVGAL